ncbi:MAG TPA: hypothetical protein VFD64_20040 [Gemmatimonadaceae bacterium]|nr:hypothetical protein [Gemmatimonadaceae bacterium]
MTAASSYVGADLALDLVMHCLPQMLAESRSRRTVSACDAIEGLWEQAAKSSQ